MIRPAPLLALVIASGLQAVAAGDPPIRLGHYGSMSGSLASFGESTDRAIRLAVDRANARGGVNGRRIEVFTEDDQSNPDQVVPSVLALIDRQAG